MRFSKLLPFLLILLIALPGLSQDAHPAPQDDQAVSVLNQALNAAGGTAAISAITDYTATGTVTYHLKTDVQGNMTLQGRGSDEVRLDAVLPNGTRSWAVVDGQTTMKMEDGELTEIPPQLEVVPSTMVHQYPIPQFPSSLTVPALQLGSLVSNPQYSLSYKGLVQIDGHSVHNIQIQFFPGGYGGVAASRLTADFTTREIFVDASTLQIVATQEGIFVRAAALRIHYSNYQTINGVPVPYSISGTFGEQPLWSAQLSQINFNTGLQDSAFAIQ